MELGDGQSKRIDDLELRKYPGLIADLFRIQVVRDTEQPMFRPGIARGRGRVELVECNER